jgi:sporulation protein YlmC with PRC-barrel domain
MPALADDMQPTSSGTMHGDKEYKHGENNTATGDMAAHDGKSGKHFCSKRAEKLIGAKVDDASGHNIGTIEDLAIDPTSGRIVYGVLSTGGLLGLGSKSFAVPLCSLEHSRDNTFVLNVDKSRLENADGFNRDNWPTMADAQWMTRTHRDADNNATSSSMRNDYGAETNSATSQSYPNEQPRTYTQRSTPGTDVGETIADRPAGVTQGSGMSPVASLPAGITNGDNRTLADYDQANTQPATRAPIARTASFGAGTNSGDWSQNTAAAATIIRAKALIGEEVKDAQGESLGSVKDLVVDSSNGRVSCAVLTCGGVLGLGEKLHAVPWQKLNIVTDTSDKDQPIGVEHVTLNVTKENLKNAPNFAANEWPTDSDDQYYVTVYRFYAVPAYWE